MSATRLPAAEASLLSHRPVSALGNRSTHSSARSWGLGKVAKEVEAMHVPAGVRHGYAVPTAVASIPCGASTSWILVHPNDYCKGNANAVSIFSFLYE